MEDYRFHSNLSSAFLRQLVNCCGTEGLESTGPWAAVMEIPQGGNRSLTNSPFSLRFQGDCWLPALTHQSCLFMHHGQGPDFLWSGAQHRCTENGERLGVKDFQVKLCRILGLLGNKDAQVHTESCAAVGLLWVAIHWTNNINDRSITFFFNGK